MRKAVRSLITVFVILSLLLVPTMSMAAAGAAAQTAARSAGLFGLSTPVLIIGGLALAAVTILVITTVDNH